MNWKLKTNMQNFPNAPKSEKFANFGGNYNHPPPPKKKKKQSKNVSFHGTDRLLPSWQCTRTFPPEASAAAIISKAWSWKQPCDPLGGGFNHDMRKSNWIIFPQNGWTYSLNIWNHHRLDTPRNITLRQIHPRASDLHWQPRHLTAGFHIKWFLDQCCNRSCYPSSPLFKCAMSKNEDSAI